MFISLSVSVTHLHTFLIGAFCPALGSVFI